MNNKIYWLKRDLLKRKLITKVIQGNLILFFVSGFGSDKISIAKLVGTMSCQKREGSQEDLIKFED